MAYIIYATAKCESKDNNEEGIHVAEFWPGDVGLAGFGARLPIHRRPCKMMTLAIKVCTVACAS